jgi:hypothetical protein
MNRHLLFYFIGIILVFGTHIFMVFSNNQSMQIHAATNLFAGCSIAYYFMNKEGFIKF